MPSLPNRSSVPGRGSLADRAQQLKALEEARQRLHAAETSDSPAEAPEEAAPGTGPVGSGTYEVHDGDCIQSIAKNSGHFWETIWNDAGNAELREVRKDHNILLPGDLVTIPPLRQKEEPGETEARHRFKRKGEPAMLRLRLGQEIIEPEPAEEETPPHGLPPPERTRREDYAYANLPYLLIIDGVKKEGVTDPDGHIECPIPGNARGGTLILNPGEENETRIRLHLGALGPVSEISGVKERLTNLGFPCNDGGDNPTPQLAAALSEFQEKYGLPVTGEADEETLAALDQAYEE